MKQVIWNLKKKQGPFCQGWCPGLKYGGRPGRSLWWSKRISLQGRRSNTGDYMGSWDELWWGIIIWPGKEHEKIAKMSPKKRKRNWTKFMTTNIKRNYSLPLRLLPLSFLTMVIFGQNDCFSHLIIFVPIFISAKGWKFLFQSYQSKKYKQDLLDNIHRWNWKVRKGEKCGAIKANDIKGKIFYRHP